MLKTLGGRYELLELKDEGGMSFVYKAFCTKTKTTVAAKILKPEYSDNKLYVDAFRKEALHTLKLRHQNIVRIFDIGSEKGLKYIIMEYLDGPTLKEKLSEAGFFDIESCVDIGVKICDGLEYAHKRGIIHKDLKPSNIMMRDNGEPVILDFGIAEELTQQTDEHENQVLGSVQYFSPEQAKGERVDTRTDIYSLGVMMYELVTGKKPFDGEDDLSVALMHIHQDPVPPKELNGAVPNSLNKIILKAMAKKPEHRYDSAATMKRDLSLCLDNPDGGYILSREDEQERIKKHTKQNHKKMTIGVSITIGTLVIVMLSLILGLSSSIPFVHTEKNNLMPSFVNKTEKEATKSCNELGLSIEIKYDVDPSFENGVVISQNPEAGATIKRGEKITIVVNSGTMVAMPNLNGKTREQAIEALADLGLPSPQFETGNKVADSEPYVINQTPKAGEKVNSKVKIKLTVTATDNSFIGYAADYTNTNIIETAPKVIGLGYSKVFITFTMNGSKPGTIASQTPASGESLHKNDPIRFAIQPLGNSYYTCVFTPPDNFIASGGGKLMLTVKRKLGNVDCEIVVFEQDVSNNDDFRKEYGGAIQFGLYLNAEDQEINGDMTAYLNGVAFNSFNIVMEKSS